MPGGAGADRGAGPVQVSDPRGSAAALRRELGAWPWHVLSGALVVLGPAFIWFAVLPWRLATRDAPQVIAMGAAYFALATWVAAMPMPRPRWPAARVTAAAIVVFGGAWLVLSLWPEFARSRGLIALSMVWAATLAVQPLLAGRARGLFVGAAVLVASGGLARVERSGALRASAAESTQVRVTALRAIAIRYQPGLTGPVAGDGGAIAALGDGFVVVTGRGAIFRLSWDSTRTALRSERLPVSVPIDRPAFLADWGADSTTAPRLRVTDLLLDTTTSPVRAWVSHQYWNHERKCVTLRVSSTFLGDTARPADPGAAWTTEFESHPCLTMVQGYDDIETGGRLAWTPDRRLLLTIGDHGFDGIRVPAYSQDTSNSYGKVLVRDPASRAWTIFTLGHRNPQGLLVDRDGRIWESEHGPQGGDELNILTAGRNYGWPLATYGTQYGATYWPLAPDAHDHGAFTEPAFVFVPSVALSNLIEVRDTTFPEWTGDLMLSSLRTQSLWRVRHRGDRIVYVEPIQIGRRVRDLVQGADGRLVLWTDEGDVVTVGRPRVNASPDIAYGQCKGCHEPSLTGTAMAPALRGVLDRGVAAASGYPYSAAMRGLGGTWTAARLDSFLLAPSRYAPGTTMVFGGVPDAAQRRQVIEYLRGYR